MFLLSSNPIILIPQLIAGYTIYFLLKCLYRITLHPLAKFPGPKTAAASRLHAMSWDVPYATSYLKEFTTWHDKYSSPVVRIEPNHLHFRDISAYNEIFKMGTKFTRDPAIYSFPASEGSFFNKINVRDGLVHRSLYNAYFSRSAVQNVEPIIQHHLMQFLAKVDEATKLSKAVDLYLGFRCLMADSLMRYCYDRPFGALFAPDFEDPMIKAIGEMLDTGPAMTWYGGKFFVYLFQLITKMPRHWIGNKGIAETLRMLDGCNARITELSKQDKDDMAPNVFRTALKPNVEKGQPQLEIHNMAADGLVFFSAGSDTTANTLTYAIYHLIRNPSLLSKVRSELETAIPEPTTIFLPDPESTSAAADSFPLGWSALDKLPYLHGVVKESIRISYGIPGKIPRVVPPGGMVLSGHFVPGGTAVSSSTYAYHSNPEYYVDPLTFKPERWFQDDNGGWSGNNGVDPEKYFVSFLRGTRSCIGVNLAYAELNYTLAYFIRNFEMKLDESMKDTDMDWRDCFVLQTCGHLKVKLKRIEK